MSDDGKEGTVGALGWVAPTDEALWGIQTPLPATPTLSQIPGTLGLQPISVWEREDVL